MRAFVRDRYGSPDVMRVAQAPKPRIVDDEQVLVRVHATSVNAHDWHMLRGKPYIARLSEGLRQPKQQILGLDVAGVVEEVGAAVTHLRPGDEVFGSRWGAFAEYVAGKTFEHKPANLSFAEAAAVPTAGYTALQAVRDHGAVQPGERVLINGAGGGVGHLAVQIARAHGATVTAVTGPRSAEMVRSLGPDRVLDYTREDFTKGGERYDVILDAGGNRPLARMRRALEPGGRIVLIAPAGGQWVGPIARMVGARLASRFGAHRMRGFLAKPNRDDLRVLRDMLAAGTLKPVIGATYAFDQVPEAIRHVEQGRTGGKVVITLD